MHSENHALKALHCAALAVAIIAVNGSATISSAASSLPYFGRGVQPPSAGLLDNKVAPSENLTGGNVNPGVLPPGSHPFGASYGEWGGRWWRWVLSIPAGSNPLVDDASAFCDAGQTGPVWFLVGQNGTHSCTIPSGRGIFFPIINLYVNSPCGFPECAADLTPAACAANPSACQACLQTLADDFLGSVTGLNVELDGVSLRDLFAYRAGSGLFSFAAHPSLAFIDACLTVTPQPFLADGYWIMLAPLRVGSHTLHFSGAGTFLGFPFAIDVTYNLTVRPGGRGHGRFESAPDVQPGTWGMVKELYRR